MQRMIREQNRCVRAVSLLDILERDRVYTHSSRELKLDGKKILPKKCEKLSES